uniref:Uncharacterized protein n=1 Tax=Rhizophora mucronata TaxID=61149 RepID=A0A2P2PBI8_RHIMU
MSLNNFVLIPKCNCKNRVEFQELNVFIHSPLMSPEISEPNVYRWQGCTKMPCITAS